MRVIVSTLLLTLALTQYSNLNAQNIDCSSFCATRMYMDSTTPNWMLVSIEFSGGDKDFINYPHISAIIDQQGDTVATGGLWFFGQVGNTTADYPVTTVWDSIPDGFEGTLIFEFDTVACTLNFPCTPSAVFIPGDGSPLIFAPNPFTISTTLYSDKSFHNATIRISDLRGQIVEVINHITGHEMPLLRNHIPAGVYVVQLIEDGKLVAIQKLIVVD